MAIIKAGTYRWNDNIADLPHLVSALPCYIEPIIIDGASITIEPNFPLVQAYNPTEGAIMQPSIVFGSKDAGDVFSIYATFDGGRELIANITMFMPFYNGAWVPRAFVEGEGLVSLSEYLDIDFGDFGQTITVTEDTGVDDTFGAWFYANTVAESSEPPTADSVKAKIQNLIASANATTGETVTDLTSAVNALIAGYGQGGSSLGVQTCNITVNYVSKVFMLSSLSYTGVNNNLLEWTTIDVPVYDPSYKCGDYSITLNNVACNTPIFIIEDNGMNDSNVDISTSDGIVFDSYTRCLYSTSTNDGTITITCPH